MTDPGDGLAALADSVRTALGPADGSGLTVTESFGRVIATVAPDDWIPALTAARDELGADFFDWLTGVDELEDGFTVAAFVCAVGAGAGASGGISGGISGDSGVPAESDRLARGQG